MSQSNLPWCVARRPKPCVASPKKSDPMTSTRRAENRPVFFAGKRGIEAINLAMFTVENHGKISGESAKHMEFLFFFTGNIGGEDRTNDDIPWHAIIFWRVAYFQRRSRLKYPMMRPPRFHPGTCWTWETGFVINSCLFFIEMTLTCYDITSLFPPPFSPFAPQGDDSEFDRCPICR